MIIEKALAQLDGHLLGDGCILVSHSDRSTKSLVYQHSSVHREYLEWLVKTFFFLNTSKIWEVNSFDKRTNKKYHRYWTKSKSTPLLIDAKKRWYSESGKIIPKDLKLTPDSLLRFFLDDGSKATHGGIYLATDDFCEKDIQFLSTTILGQFGIQTSIHKNKSKSGDSLRLYIPRKETNLFYEIIGECPLDCFRYKWTE